MRIGKIAEQAGVSASLIRYYERKGVLPRAERDGVWNRRYGDSDLKRIRLITGLRRLGCSFIEIRNTLALVDGQCAPSSEIVELLARKKQEVLCELDRLTYIQGELSQLQELAIAVSGQQETDHPASGQGRETTGS